MTTPTAGPEDGAEPDPVDPADGAEAAEAAEADSDDSADEAAPRRRRFSMSRSTATLAMACLLLVVFVVLAATRPVPYVTLGPGPTFNTIGEYDGKPLISVKGAKTYPTKGTLDLTTVTETGGPYGRLSLGEALRGWLDPDVAVVPTELLHPPGTSNEEVEQRNQADFTGAEDAATVAAFNYLDIPYEYVVRVSSVEKGSAADGKLKTGDVVVSIDGQKAESITKARELIRATKTGSTLDIAIRRDGKAQDVTLKPKTETQDGKEVPVVGITLADDYESDVEVTYSLTGVGGPSAGLMFALGLIDLLTPTSVNGGRDVAGTGTITAEGKVGPIGGIQQKLSGARDEGASFFLVPADNCAAAKGAVPKGLTIAKVTTLDSAVDALEAYQAGKPVPPC